MTAFVDISKSELAIVVIVNVLQRVEILIILLSQSILSFFFVHYFFPIMIS